jgi:competence protein ComEC
MRSGVILWTLVCGVLLGVALRSIFFVGVSFIAYSGMLGIVSLFFYKTRGALLVALACFAIAFGVARAHASIVTGDVDLTSHADEQVTILGRVFDEPDVRDSSTRFYVDADTLITKYAKERVHGGILVIAPPHTSVVYGDPVLAYGTLRLPKDFDTSEGRQFNYPEYLAARGIQYQLTGAQIEVSGSNTGDPLKKFAFTVKQYYLRGEQAALSEPQSGLAGGITVGDKRSLGSELSADFQKVSLIHMVVLSGYNITVVINGISSMLAFAPQITRFGAAGAVVLLFILMTGSAASAVRAGLMALIAAYARMSGRTFLAGRALGVVAVGMVLYQPLVLVYDPSFQLSVLATIGLIVFTPLISPCLRHVPTILGLREIVASTLGTQLAVLPLLLYQNGNLSLVALPANLLALAPVPYAMFFSFIAALAGLLFGSYAVPLAVPAYILLSYIIAVARFFAALPYASVSLPAFSPWWLFLIYGLMFGGVVLFEAHKRGSRQGRTQTEASR